MSEEITLTRHEAATLREIWLRTEAGDDGWPYSKRTCSVSGLVNAKMLSVRTGGGFAKFSEWKVFLTPAGRSWVEADRVRQGLK